MKLCVTGFGAFPGVPLNISEQLVRTWHRAGPAWGEDAEFLVLPTSYATAGRQVRQLIEKSRPDIMIMLGVAPTTATLRLERFALNIDDAKGPDVDGDWRQGSKISGEGPTALSSNVDISRLRDALVAAGVDAETSNHAGTYVCNHAYYCALLAASLASRNTDVLFIHLPNSIDLDDAERKATTERCRIAIDRAVHFIASDWETRQ